MLGKMMKIKFKEHNVRCTSWQCTRRHLARTMRRGSIYAFAEVWFQISIIQMVISLFFLNPNTNTTIDISPTTGIIIISRKYEHSCQSRIWIQMGWFHHKNHNQLSYVSFRFLVELCGSFLLVGVHGNIELSGWVIFGPGY